MGESDTRDLAFLFEEDLQRWERPVREGYIRNPLSDMYVGSTNLYSSIFGIDHFEEKVGKYDVRASAAKYIALVQRITGESIEEVEKINPEENVIFSGGIVIYQHGNIPGTDLRGYELVTNGNIWLARKPVKSLVKMGGLANLIFGRTKSKDSQEERIKRIINGYQFQEDKKDQRESKAKSEDYRRGRADQHEKTFGTFSRGH